MSWRNSSENRFALTQALTHATIYSAFIAAKCTSCCLTRQAAQTFDSLEPVDKWLVWSGIDSRRWELACWFAGWLAGWLEVDSAGLEFA